MPKWGEILEELQNLQKSHPDRPVFDIVRRKYLKELSIYTKREVILYATKWTSPQPGIPSVLLSISDEDIQALMAVMHGLKGKKLDLILHSPGGSGEVAEAMVSYLRSKFKKDIRVIIPQAAMSAATMLACSGNSIVMGKHSYLGPIDPQMVLETSVGRQMVPAHAIIQQFERAQKECKNPDLLGSWMPMMEQYGPGLLVQCSNAIELSKELVTEWLAQYMFRGKKDGLPKAQKIAKALADHPTFKSHSRYLNRNYLKKIGLQIENLEEDQRFQDLVLSVFHATTHTLENSSAVKIVENHLGKAYVKHAPVVQVIRQEDKKSSAK